MSIKRVLFYGDSNTWGYRPGGERIPANRRYTTMVTRQALNVFPVVDGLNGRCSAWTSTVFPGELLGGASLADSLKRHAPLDGLVIMLGTNDVMPPLNCTADEICANQRRMIETARSLYGPELVIVLVSPPPMTMVAMESLLPEGGSLDILSQDLASPLEALALQEHVSFLDGGSIVPAMDASDGYHLEEVGHLRLGLAIGNLLRANRILNPEPRPRTGCCR